MNHPRGITERVERFNQEGREKGESGDLRVSTFDASDLFTNISREVFLADLIEARRGIRERMLTANYF